MLRGRRLTTAWVGDSKAVLARQVGRGRGWVSMPEQLWSEYIADPLIKRRGKLQCGCRSLLTPALLAATNLPHRRRPSGAPRPARHPAHPRPQAQPSRGTGAHPGQRGPRGAVSGGRSCRGMRRREQQHLQGCVCVCCCAPGGSAAAVAGPPFVSPTTCTPGVVHALQPNCFCSSILPRATPHTSPLSPGWWTSGASLWARTASGSPPAGSLAWP